MKNKKSDYVGDTPDTADMGELFIQYLMQDMEKMYIC